jgi:hypothetical protein
MATATQARTSTATPDKGEWLARLLDDVRSDPAYQPAPIAVLRMRTRLFEGMAPPARKAA